MTCKTFCLQGGDELSQLRIDSISVTKTNTRYEVEYTERRSNNKQPGLSNSSSRPLGKNYYNKLIIEAFEIAMIDHKKDQLTLRSIRPTIIQRLAEKNIHPEVMRLMLLN